MATFEGQVADALVAALEANKATVVAALTAGEASVETLISNALNNFKPSGAILPLIWDALKPAILAELVAIEAQESGTVLFALIDSEAHKLALQVGG